MIAFLHTSEVHIARFGALVRKYDEAITIRHYVNEKLLETALLNGKTDTPTFDNEIETIRKEAPSLLICTCSTYGKECDKYDDVERIDEPIGAYLVANYNTIGLVYTANSTKTVSEDLLFKMAFDQNKEIKVVNCDCSDYWTHFEQGNYVAYEKGIAEKIKSIESNVDVVFLAQASMEGAKKYLTDITKKVFSSPEFGIKTFLRERWP